MSALGRRNDQKTEAHVLLLDQYRFPHCRGSPSGETLEADWTLPEGRSSSLPLGGNGAHPCHPVCPHTGPGSAVSLPESPSLIPMRERTVPIKYCLEVEAPGRPEMPGGSLKAKHREPDAGLRTLGRLVPERGSGVVPSCPTCPWGVVSAGGGDPSQGLGKGKAQQPGGLPEDPFTKMQFRTSTQLCAEHCGI